MSIRNKVKRVVFGRADCIHVETDLGVINITRKLTDNAGRAVESIAVHPDAGGGLRAPHVVLAGLHNTRLIACRPAETSHEVDAKVNPQPLATLGVNAQHALAWIMTHPRSRWCEMSRVNVRPYLDDLLHGRFVEADVPEGATTDFYRYRATLYGRTP